MRILHTEASTGWGGQEIRIYTEAKGMLERGHDVVLVTNIGAQLAERAKKNGLKVYEIDMSSRFSLKALWQLIRIIQKEKIDIVNTHSSIDSWLGGLAARLTGRKIIRTRHLSTPSHPGLNSKVVYDWLADVTITTCESVAETLRNLVGLSTERCLSIPSGMNPEQLQIKSEEIHEFRAQWGIKPTDCLAGSVCVLRSWKGIIDLIHAAKTLETDPHLKWLIVGDGPSRDWYQSECSKLQLEDKIIFTGHLEKPFVAMAALDVFLLLSHANEGVSQASLQAAYLKKPLITTTVGGLPEVCLNEVTGFHVPISSPTDIAEKIRLLASESSLRDKMGEKAHELVVKQFTIKNTLDSMENVYKYLYKKPASYD